MRSRYRVLHTLGTLSLILAWVLLILGIVGAIGSSMFLGGFVDSINSLLGGAFTLPRSLSLAGVIPALLWGIAGFLQFFVIGKVLQLLVDMDETTLGIAQSAKQAPEASSQEPEISGELKRQAKLIAATLESTQQLQQQVAGLEAKMDQPALVDEFVPLDEEPIDLDVEDDVVVDIDPVGEE